MTVNEGATCWVGCGKPDGPHAHAEPEHGDGADSKHSPEIDAGHPCARCEVLHGDHRGIDHPFELHTTTDPAAVFAAAAETLKRCAGSGNPPSPICKTGDPYRHPAGHCARCGTFSFLTKRGDIQGHTFMPERPFDGRCRHGMVMGSGCAQCLQPVDRSMFTGAPVPLDAEGERMTFDTDEDSPIDEVVLHGADVHLERLDVGVYMLIVHNERHWWHLNIGSRTGRAEVNARLFERFDGPEAAAMVRPAADAEGKEGKAYWRGVAERHQQQIIEQAATIAKLEAAHDEALDVIADLVNQFAYRIKDNRQPSGMNVCDGASSTLEYAFRYLGLPEVNDEKEWMKHLLNDAIEAKRASALAPKEAHDD